MCDTQNNNYKRLRSNLIFSGVPEKRGEDCVREIDRIIYQHMGLRNAWEQIDKSHRLGKFRSDRTRPIIVKFKTHSAKETTYSRRTWLAGTGIVVKLHQPEPQQRLESTLDKIATMARQYDSTARKTGDKLVYKGKIHDINSILNSDLPVHQINERETAEAIGFLGHLSPLSNFFKCDIQNDGLHYENVEKYYQFQKATHYGDVERAAEIFIEEDPYTIKKVSKGITLPNGERPMPDREFEESIMKKVLKVKFSKEPMKSHLLRTGDKLLVECNEHDSYWGCGLPLKNEDFRVKAKWKGLNNLGLMLQNLRKELIED